MKSLEDLILEASAEREDMTYLSVIPHKNGWSATFAPARTSNHFICIGKNPVDAMKAVLTEGLKRRRAVKDDEDFG